MIGELPVQGNDIRSPDPDARQGRTDPVASRDALALGYEAPGSCGGPQWPTSLRTHGFTERFWGVVGFGADPVRGARPTMSEVMVADQVRIAICVATRDRSGGVRRLLRSLANIHVDDDVRVRIVLVDNNHDGREVAAAADLQKVAVWPLDSRHEPQQGIPFARNTSVAAALEFGHLLVFVDDDEEVSPSWLTALLDARERYNADVVVGPVVPVLPPGAPAWTARGFPERTRRSSGTPLPTAPTNNTMVDASWFHRLDRWFDPTMARSGGSDTELFARMADAGARIVWADAAVAYEHVTRGRARVRWVVRRSYRLGVTEGQLLRRTGRGGKGQLLIRATKSFGHVVVGSVRAVSGIVLGSRHLVTGLRQAAWGMGWLWGLVGGTYDEY